MMAVATSGHNGGGGKAGFIIVGIFFVLVGLLNVVKPDLSYRMNRWQYKNKQAWEPSNAALVAARVGGCVAVVIGIVVVVIGARR